MNQYCRKNVLFTFVFEETETVVSPSLACIFYYGCVAIATVGCPVVLRMLAAFLSSLRRRPAPDCLVCMSLRQCPDQTTTSQLHDAV